MTIPVPLAIVVAVAENGVIGRENGLAWRLRTDLKRFREITWGKPLIMGRRTFESIGKPLPGRETIVLTRSRAFRPAGVEVAHDWADAKGRALAAASRMGAGEIAVVGGGEIYRLALPEAARIHLTVVEANPEGDTSFPEVDPGLFVEVARERHEAGPADEHAFSFVELERRRKPPQP